MDKFGLHKRCRAGRTQHLLAVVTLHTQNPCFRGVNSTVIIIGPTPANSCFIDLPCVFHWRHRRSRRRSSNGVDFLVFRFCQTFPAVCPLVTFLATMATLTFRLGGEPTSFLDHVYLGCTQRQCEISKDIVDNYRTMFESRISAGGTEKLPFPQNLRISSWSYNMEGHAKKCVERYCELANKTTQQLYKVSTPCIDDHHFKEEEMKSVGELSQVCSQIVLKCLYLARIGRPDNLWSVNKLARSITTWTKACDKRLNRLIIYIYIHHTCEHKQYCHVGNTAKQCRLGLFQALTSREILKIRNPLLEEHCAFLEVIHLFRYVVDVQETDCRFAQFNRI